MATVLAKRSHVNYIFRSHGINIESIYQLITNVRCYENRYNQAQAKKDAALVQHLLGGCLRNRTSRGLPLCLAQPTLRSPLSILLQHPEPPVGTIPRTPITPIQINTIKSRPFISNLISIPFLNFLAIVKDKVESNHNRPQIKDYERRRILRRLWCG